MGKLIKEEPEKGRLHIESRLMGESLVSKTFLKTTEATDYFRMHPDVNVLKIGGQSIMDRGAKALLPGKAWRAKWSTAASITEVRSPVSGMSTMRQAALLWEVYGIASWTRSCCRTTPSARHG
jgi:hypothetical protein